MNDTTLTLPDWAPDQTSWKIFVGLPGNKILYGDDWIAQTRPPVLIMEVERETES